VVIALTLAGCAAQATPSPSPPPAGTALPIPSPAASPTALPSPTAGVTVSGPLGEALAHAGPIPELISFTDWAAIKASAGAPGLTGESPLEDKLRAIRNEASFGGFGLREIRTHALDWGFDVMDLDWEAQVSGPGVFWVLRLREGFDLARLTDKLDAYGFATEQLPHGTLRVGTVANFTQGGRQLGNVAFLRTGVLDDGRTLVLSSFGDPARGDPVRQILTDGPRPVADLSAQSVAGLLDGPSVASILVGWDCRQLVAQGFGSVNPEVRAKIDRQLAAAGPLTAYNALAIGYDRDPDLHGRVVIGYPEEGQAQADLEGRRFLAETGISAATRSSTVPLHYSERMFTLERASVAERAIILDLVPVAEQVPTPSGSGSLRPTESFPRRLAEMVLSRDLLFAAC
jgi:hypothetical protein